MVLPTSMLFAIQVNELETIKVQEFDIIDAKNLTVFGPFNIYLSQGPSPSLRFEGSKEILDKVCIDQSNEQLTVNYQIKSKLGFLGKKVSMFLQMPSLKEIRLHGNVQLIGESEFYGESLYISLHGLGKVTLAVHLKSLDAELNGNGNFLIAGSVQNQYVNINGDGHYKADKLQNESSNIILQGLGNAYLNVSKDLNAKVYGTGNIYYKGFPKVNCQSYGPGDVKPI